MKNCFLLICISVIIVLVIRFVSPELPDLVEMVNPAIVQIEVIDEYGREWLGSGVIVHRHGLILTAKHIVEDANELTIILANGEEYKSINKMIDPNNDVGIIHIALLEYLSTVTFANDVQIGEKVFIVGSPFGYSNSVAVGIVAGEDRDVPFFGIEPMLQLDIAGNPGNSGCGVFNLDCRLVGILVGRIYNSDGINFAIPSDICKLLAEKYINEYKNGSQTTLN